MNTYLQEVDNEFENHFSSLKDEIIDSISQLDTEKNTYKESYRRILSFQGWRIDIIEKQNNEDAQAFFLEAQNDLIMSHSLARQGSWRTALMSLRSAIENTLFCLYYLEHPVELSHWKMGRHKLGFAETCNYLSDHPEFFDFNEDTTGISQLKSEYATLSKAVHGSANHFRVTQNGEILGLNNPKKPELGKWSTREKNTIYLLNLVLMVFFKSKLRGAINQNLRKAISLATTESQNSKIKNNFGISLRKN